MEVKASAILDEHMGNLMEWATNNERDWLIICGLLPPKKEDYERIGQALSKHNFKELFAMWATRCTRDMGWKGVLRATFVEVPEED